MAYLEPFQRSGYSLEERIGDPLPFDAAVGLVALGFSDLEDTLSRALGRLLGIGWPETAAVTAEMSFRNKVHVFASLTRLQFGIATFNPGNVDPEQYLRELVAGCFKTEEMRNAVMHSSWAYDGSAGAQTRRRTKTTAKASRGVHIHAEVLSAGDVMDVYDYALYVATVIDEFFGLWEGSERSSPAT